MAAARSHPRSNNARRSAMAIPLKLNGRAAQPELPPLLQTASRAAGAQEDPFLPAGYLVPTATFDVGPTARSTPEGVSETRHQAQSDEIVVLELADGSTFIS